MATALIDTSTFQLGAPHDHHDGEEGDLLDALAIEARAFIQSRPWAPPVDDLVLAYGVGGVIGLFLVRYAHALDGPLDGETEMWLVVGDLPTVAFETESAPTPAVALTQYCAICQDWADAVLAGRDLSQCYPLMMTPTRELAQMLQGRIAFVRETLVPHA